jgi:ABC-2 type transport system permease protein
VSTEPAARIYDLGYRAYDGPRRGTGWAPVTIWSHTVQRVLGLRRSFRHKILPGLALVIAFVPALIFVGIAAFLPVDLIGDDILPSYGEYYGFITTALVLFAAFIAPEALCTDRRTRMLDLYLAGPLDVRRYLLAKWAAVAAVLLTMTVGPQLFMLVAFTIEAAGPPLRDVPELLLEIAIAGAGVALFATAVSMGVSSTTSRKAVAAVSTVLLFLVPNIVVDVVVENTDAPDELAVLTSGVAGEFAWRVFGETRPTSDVDIPIERVSTPLVAAGMVGWVLVGAIVCSLGYRRLARTR